MLDRFGAGADQNLVRACVLAPESVLDPTDLVGRAQHVNAFWKASPNLYIQGLAHYRAGQYERAVECLREAWTLDPDWPVRAITYPALAMAYHRLGKADEARQMLSSTERVIDGWTEAIFKGEVGTMPIPWSDWLECRHLCHEAKLLLTGSLPPDDRRLRAISERALAALSFGDVDVLLDHGRARAFRGEWDQAAADYARALDLIPHGLSYFSNVSLLCADMVKTPEVFNRLVERRPKDARLWVTRGRSYARQRQWDKAVADYARVMESRPPDDGSTFEYACLLLLSGDDDGYRRLCQRLVERYEQSTDAFTASSAIRTCGLAPGAVSDPARLVRWAEVWMERQPHTGWARVFLGMALYRAGRWAEAVPRLREGKEFHPNWPGHCVDDMFLALAHVRLGQRDEARRRLDLVNRWLAGADHDLAEAKFGFPPTVHPSDWLIVQVLRREADRVLAEPPGQVKQP
jgi:Flp pilus assembly protein TadD